MTMIGKTDIQKNRWYHFAVSWDGTTRRIYLNGSLEASDSPSGTLSSIIYDLHIGGRQNYFLDGKIDEVQVWNTARSQSDIQNTIYQSLIGSENGLVLYYNFNQIEAIFIKDISGTINDGDIKSGCKWVQRTNSDLNIVKKHWGNDKVTYNVTLKTGNVSGAGTDSNIWIKIYGSLQTVTLHDGKAINGRMYKLGEHVQCIGKTKSCFILVQVQFRLLTR